MDVRFFAERRFSGRIREGPLRAESSRLNLALFRLEDCVDQIRKALKGTAGCKVEICAIDDQEARATANKLRDIFTACGFLVSMMPSSDRKSEGLQLETNSRNAAAALAIQSAFHQARIDTTLLLQDKGPRDVVVVKLGRHGLS